MASSGATTQVNNGQVTPESTPGPDTDRLAADKERQKAQAAPTSHGLATPDATPEPDEARIQADNARQQQAENASSQEAPSTRSKAAAMREEAESLPKSGQAALKQIQAKKKQTSTAGVKKSTIQSKRQKGKANTPRSRSGEEPLSDDDDQPDPMTDNPEPSGDNADQPDPITDNPEPSGDNADQPGPIIDAPEPQNESRASPTTATKSWEPGLTRKGEPILGYRTIGGDGKGNPRGHQFLVQAGTKEKPQYNLQSGSEIGRRASDGYLGMDESKKNRLGDTDKKYSRDDAKDYRGIKFVASKPIQTKLAGSGFRFPASICMVSFANPDREDLMWRSTLRTMLGKTDADADIEEYYDKNGLKRPWEVAPTSYRNKEEDDKPKTRTRTEKNQTRKETPTEDSPNRDAEGEENQSKEELQAKVVDLESKMDRLLKLMEQQNSAKN